MKTEYDSCNIGTNSIGIMAFTAITIFSAILSSGLEFSEINTNGIQTKKIVINNLKNSGGEHLFSEINDAEKSSYIAHPLSKFIGTWQGNDIDDLLELAYSTRSKF